jgi:hypothetical protein
MTATVSRSLDIMDTAFIAILIRTPHRISTSAIAIPDSPATA